MSSRVWFGLTCRFRKAIGQQIRQFVADRPGASLERFAGPDRLHEPLAATFEELDVGALLSDSPMGKEAQGFDGRGCCPSCLQSSQQVFATFLIKVEKHVFLAGEMIEDRHPRNVRGLRDLVHGDLIEPSFDEKARSNIRDLLPCGKALPSPAILRNGQHGMLQVLYRVYSYTQYISGGSFMNPHSSAQHAGLAAEGKRQHLHVLVSGASFAGLATAFWMNRLGYAVTVVEVGKGLKLGGTPVDIKEGTVDIVKRMGLLERIQAASLNGKGVDFLDAAGVTIAKMPSQERDAQHSTPEYEIERDTLLQMMFEEVMSDVEFIFDDRIASLDESADEVAVTFKSGKRRTFSLLFGCDGNHSSVRRLCFGEESAYSHFLKNYFSITIVDKLLIEENTAQMYNVPGKVVMLNAYNNKTDIIFCFHSEKEIPYNYRDQDEQRRIILQQFNGEGWRTRELLAEMSHCRDFYFDKMCQIRMPSWAKGRVALVGDAAYCASPAAGMGGSLAIVGAAALADAFQKHPGNFVAAFQEYNDSLRPFVEGVQAEVLNFGLDLFVPRTAEALQRRNAQFSLG